MWPASLARLLRRRMLYILLTLLIIIYLIFQLLGKNGTWRDFQYDESMVQRTHPLIWRTLQQSVKPTSAAGVESDYLTPNVTVISDTTCRNSVQGRDLLVDERGYVCVPDALEQTGCCNITDLLTTSYDCQTCNTTSHCCNIYEYCVSCCLHPDKRPILELVLNQIRGSQALVFAAVPDHFELCLVKCRTSSHSVQHENRYRDANNKYCYGQTTAHESEVEVLGGAVSVE